MKKNTYKLEHVDCAACGAKVEERVNKLEGVLSSKFNFMFMKFYVDFNEEVISDEEIELVIHKSVSGVRIVSKNNQDFIDEYEEPKMFKKLPFSRKIKLFERKNI